MAFTNFWQLLAGLGIFLYGMFLLETTVKKFGGRSFKLFLKTHTSSRLKSILSGTLITGILQSSSVVNLMVLTFAGADLISMSGSLGLVLGSNIGGTFNSWIVAFVGFKFDFEKFTYPIIAIAGAGLIIFNDSRKIYQVSKFFIGLGFLFLGLLFMKESMDLLIKKIDFEPYLNYSNFLFVLFGFLFTAIVQTSAATVVVALGALNVGAISLEIAISVVLGAELGTTIKLVLGAINGIPTKKRLAYANFLFNLCTTIIGYFSITSIIYFFKNILGIKDPLIMLVFFQTILNVGGVILFFPFINQFSIYLEKHFIRDENAATFYIHANGTFYAEAIFDVLEKETLLFIHQVIDFNLASFHIIDFKIDRSEQLNKIINDKNREFQSYLSRYEHVKQAEGEILFFYSSVKKDEIDKPDFNRLNQLIMAVRNAMYSAKGMKDIHQDRENFHNTGNDSKYEQYKLLKKQLHDFYFQVNQILSINDKSICYEKLMQLMNKLKTDYEFSMNNIYKQSQKELILEVDISTLLNVNRELYSSCKALLHSLKDFLLDASQAEKFNNTLLG